MPTGRAAGPVRREEVEAGEDDDSELDELDDDLDGDAA